MPNNTATSVPSNTATATNTSVPSNTATATPCAVSFSDVRPNDYFYEAVQYLACRGIVSGYADGTFRPYNNITRAQYMKVLVLSQGWTLLNPATPRFSDVPRGDGFYTYIETAAARGVISGYADGTFRPGNPVTRAQICKAIVLARGWTLLNPATPRFRDVPAGDTFYRYIETAAAHGIITGYADGTFKPGNPATRGQLAKIVYLAVS